MLYLLDLSGKTTYGWFSNILDVITQHVQVGFAPPRPTHLPPFPLCKCNMLAYPSNPAYDCVFNALYSKVFQDILLVSLANTQVQIGAISVRSKIVLFCISALNIYRNVRFVLYSMDTISN